MTAEIETLRGIKEAWKSLESVTAQADSDEARREERDEAMASGRRLRGGHVAVSSSTRRRHRDTTDPDTDFDTGPTASSSSPSRRRSAATTAVVGVDTASLAAAPGRVAVERAERLLSLAKADQVTDTAPNVVRINTGRR